MILTTVIALSLLAVIVWHLRRSSSKSAQVEHEKKESAPSFPAVKIRCGKKACSGATDLRGQTLLAAEAPTLPLAQCSLDTCDCQYEKTSDRRQDIRRNSDVGIGNSIFSAAEKRQSNDRRRS